MCACCVCVLHRLVEHPRTIPINGGTIGGHTKAGEDGGTNSE